MEDRTVVCSANMYEIQDNVEEVLVVEVVADGQNTECSLGATAVERR